MNQSEPFEMINIERNISLNNLQKEDDENSLNKDKLKAEIYNNIIYDHIKTEINNNLYQEKKFKNISLFFTIIKYICLVAVPIISLSSPNFKEYQNNLSYSAGVLSSVALGFERLQKLCEQISKNKKDEFNKLLEQVNIKSFKLIDNELKLNNIN